MTDQGEVDGHLVDEVVRALLAAPPRAGLTRVLAVDGRSGSGKTTFAETVLAALQQAAPDRSTGLVHLDEVYPGWDGLASAVPVLADGVLAALATGRPAGFTAWDWYAGAPGGHRPVPAADLLVVEGAGAGSRACAPYLSLLVWLEAPVEVRRRRALQRDGEVFAPHWDRWAAQEDRLFPVERTRQRADRVLHTG